MSLDLSALKAAVDTVATNILAVSSAIANPAVDNNDQQIIDELTTRLNNSAAALQAAVDEENAEKGVVPAAAPADPAPAASSAPVDPSTDTAADPTGTVA